MRLPVWLRWRTENDLDDEIQSHLEFEIRGNLDQGFTLEQAKQIALRRFGNQTRVKEEVREGDPFFSVETFMRDMLYGFRNLRRAVGFTFVAIVSLAVGIGANTLIFSVLNGTLLKALPLPEPDRLAAIWTVPVRDREQLVTSSLSTYFGFHDHNLSFASLGAFNGAACGVRSLGTDQDGARLNGSTANASPPLCFQSSALSPRWVVTSRKLRTKSTMRPQSLSLVTDCGNAASQAIAT